MNQYETEIGFEFYFDLYLGTKPKFNVNEINIEMKLIPDFVLI